MAEDAITAAITSAASEAGIIETSSDGAVIESYDPGGDSQQTSTPPLENLSEETGDESDTPAVGTEASPSASDAVKPPVEEPVVDEEPAEFRTNNPIPQKRVKVMVSKAEAKGRAAAQAEITTRDSELSRLRPIEQEFQRFSAAAENDPERLIEALAVANPRVWKPIQARLAGAPQATGKQAPAAEPSFVGKPRPQPNYKNADGSMTYDEAGLDQLLAWTSENAAAKALAQAEARLEERLSPIENDRRQQAFKAEQAPKIKATIEAARAEWGELFDEDYARAESGQPSEIITYMNAHKVSFDRACTAVLLPKLKAQAAAKATDARKKVIAEMNQRPAAAAAGVRSSASAQKGERTMEQIIRDEAIAAGLKL
jgi:hypothetical protein